MPYFFVDLLKYQCYIIVSYISYRRGQKYFSYQKLGQARKTVKEHPRILG
jgi:hypothetical protein